MAKRTPVQELQEYADHIWSVGEYTVYFVGGKKGYMLRDNVDGLQRLLGRNAAEAHAELDNMADLKEVQTVDADG